ncbi:MAG: type VI secretion system baseplate subunit TssE [Planctomycetota bacterium]
MPDLTPVEQLQPSLLDRLTDDEPEVKVESRDKRVLSVQRLREAVLRDLAWLLNSGNHDGADQFEGYEHVESSVLNFGMRDVTGGTASGLKLSELEERIKLAVQRFEPRIMPDELEVRAKLPDHGGTGNQLMIEIEGDLWANPLPEHLFLHTEIDLETGQFKVEKGR